MARSFPGSSSTTSASRVRSSARVTRMGRATPRRWGSGSRGCWSGCSPGVEDHPGPATRRDLPRIEQLARGDQAGGDVHHRRAHQVVHPRGVQGLRRRTRRRRERRGRPGGRRPASRPTRCRRAAPGVAAPVALAGAVAPGVATEVGTRVATGVPPGPGAPATGVAAPTRTSHPASTRAAPTRPSKPSSQAVPLPYIVSPSPYGVFDARVDLRRPASSYGHVRCAPFTVPGGPVWGRGPWEAGRTTQHTR